MYCAASLIEGWVRGRTLGREVEGEGEGYDLETYGTISRRLAPPWSPQSSRARLTSAP